MRTHDELRAAIGAYVLAALPRDEHDEVARHVMACDECAAEVESLEPIVASLAHAVPPATVPPHLRQRVLEQIARERAGRSAPAPAAAGARWVLAPAAVLILASVGYAVSLRSRVADLEAQLAAALARVAAAEQASLVAQAEIRHIRQTAGILIAADAVRVALAPQDGAAGATGLACWSPSRGLMVSASGLPPVPPDRVYQVWALTGLSPLTAVSAGLLTTGPAGDGLLVNDALPVTPVAFAVTLEPAGGVPAPTGPRYLVGAR